MADIQLNLVNHSREIDNPSFLIYQINHAQGAPTGRAIAWQVVQNLGIGDHHPISYAPQLEFACTIADDNTTAHIAADYGTLLSLKKESEGVVLTADGTGVPDEIMVANNLAQGDMAAHVYRNGAMVANWPAVLPGSKAAFKFEPILYILPVDHNTLQEGQSFSIARLTTIPTEIALGSIASADIVIQGGGAGADATPITFTLENMSYN